MGTFFYTFQSLSLCGQLAPTDESWIAAHDQSAAHDGHRNLMKTGGGE